MAHELHKVSVREKLAPRREPYWGTPVERGLYLGFRRLEHGGNWIARYRNEDGKQVYHALGQVTAENDYEHAKREARRWRKTVEAGVRSAGVETVADACREYLAALRRDKRNDTAQDAVQRFNRTVYNDPIGKVKLGQLRERHLDEWRERLLTGTFTPVPVKGARKVAPLSPAVFKRTLSAVKAALNYAVRKRHVAPERAFEWQAIRPEKDADGRRELYLDREQRRALLRAMTGGMRDLAECIALTGCRPGDPAAVLRRDYDARTGSVTFTTKDHPRTVPLSPAARALFDRLAEAKLPQAYLFTQDDGRPWNSRAWFEEMRAAVTAAGLPAGTVLYTLRHSWITDAIVGGMDLLTVAKLVGTSLAMIEKHYGHLVHSAARERLAQISFI